MGRPMVLCTCGAQYLTSIVLWEHIEREGNGHGRDLAREKRRNTMLARYAARDARGTL